MNLSSGNIIPAKGHSAKSAIVRELLGHLIVLLPVAIILFIGLLGVNAIRKHFDRGKYVTMLPLSVDDAVAQLGRCPVLAADHVLDVKAIHAQSATRREVDYEYVGEETSAKSTATAQFAWSKGAWHAVSCR
jgi:hypothetical protein